MSVGKGGGTGGGPSLLLFFVLNDWDAFTLRADPGGLKIPEVGMKSKYMELILDTRKVAATDVGICGFWLESFVQLCLATNQLDESKHACTTRGKDSLFMQMWIMCSPLQPQKVAAALWPAGHMLSSQLVDGATICFEALHFGCVTPRLINNNMRLTFHVSSAEENMKWFYSEIHFISKHPLQVNASDSNIWQ